MNGESKSEESDADPSATGMILYRSTYHREAGDGVETGRRRVLALAFTGQQLALPHGGEYEGA